MTLKQKIAMLTMLAAIQFPFAGYAAEEDRDLALIASEQERSNDERLDDINPALTDSITTEPAQETDKEIRERKKKLKQMRKEKEKENERLLRESANRRERPRNEADAATSADASTSADAATSIVESARQFKCARSSTNLRKFCRSRPHGSFHSALHAAKIRLRDYCHLRGARHR